MSRLCRVFVPALSSVALLGLLLLSLAGPLQAAIVYSQPNGDTTQPSDDPLWNSTVQWLGTNGGGTIIGPHTFISARHVNPGPDGLSVSLTTTIGGVTNTQSYTTIADYNVPNTDLMIWTVSGTFPAASIVPLYSGAAGTETGQAMTMMGYGYHIQGTPVVTGGVNNGWLWNGNYGSAGQKNLGTNTVAGITSDGAAGSPTLVYSFSTAGGTQAIDSLGDSGGGVFINVGGTWQLAGVQYAVLPFYSAPNASSLINGAIYNAQNLYVQTGSTTYAKANTVFNPLETGAITSQWGYASEVVPYREQILAAIVPEPSSLVLGAMGAAGFLIMALRRRRAR